jgi:hypothetical protein
MPQNIMEDGPGLAARGRQTKATMNTVAPEMKAPPAAAPQEVDKIHPKGKYGTNKGENRNLPVDQWSKPLGSLEKGTPHVPQTGNYKLHEGEAVIPAKDNMDPLALVPGRSEEKPKKEIHEVRTRKATKGGFIHEHHHTRPEHHKMEEHTSPDVKGMLAHMNEHMGDGSSDADVTGTPAGAPPAAGAPSAAPAV